MAKWKSPYPKGPGTQREREGRLSKAKTEKERLQILKEYGPRKAVDETEGVRRLRKRAKARNALG